MVIDIRAHLRRLVLAASPLLGGGCGPLGLCPEEVDLFPPGPIPAGAQTETVSYDPDDPTLAAYHAQCTAGDPANCSALCYTVLNTSARVPPGMTGAVYRCRLGCDVDGDGDGERLTLTYQVQPARLPVPGRRHEGSTVCTAQAPGTTLRAWALACTEAEAASVIAFQRLARELHAHGAPSALTGRARQAARDEARHTRQMLRLARRLGGDADATPPAPADRGRVLLDLPVRSLAEVALENAREGCVGETYAAAVALWQAAWAGVPVVRHTMAAIARDEAEHAQLAWDVDAWASRQLPEGAAIEVRAARHLAAAALLPHAAEAVEPALVEQAGLPPPAAATHLAHHLFAGLPAGADAAT